MERERRDGKREKLGEKKGGMNDDRGRRDKWKKTRRSRMEI